MFEFLTDAKHAYVETQIKICFCITSLNLVDPKSSGPRLILRKSEAKN